MSGEDDGQAVRVEVFWRVHEGLPKQGPGSDASTRRALRAAGPFPDTPRILDLGCGPGRQSIVLASDTGGNVVAVDLLEPFLAQLDARSAAEGFANRITTRCASMADLDDPDASYDLVWSEGAIYNMGFSKGLEGWRRLLPPGGTLAVTELSWLTDARDEDVEAFWAENYPGLGRREDNERRVAEAGYRLRESFVLPENEWWDDYYSLIESRVEALRAERSDAAWREAIETFDEELRIVRKGLGSFGYVFYVMEKVL